MLHWLGGSAKSWTETSERLVACGFQCVALDLPGFGRAVEVSDVTVADSVTSAIETIQSIRNENLGPWFLAGHSMGGKFGSLVARAAADGEFGLDDLRGLLLVSPSPPGPEPIDESNRIAMLESLGRSTGNALKDSRYAEKYIDDNVGKLPLLDKIRSCSVDDVLRMNRSAFSAWLTDGSKEDWSGKVGVIHTPALVLAGTEEPALGPAAQQRLTLPHLTNAKLVALEGGGHLGPLERPSEIADRFIAFIRSLDPSVHPAPPQLDRDFQELINSDRTSSQTRAVLNRRLAEDSSTTSGSILSPEELLALRALADAIIPGYPFDLASAIDCWLALPTHDGWRHDSLQPDLEAWRIGIRSINAAALREHEVPFIALDTGRQVELLTKAAIGKLGNSFLNVLSSDRDDPNFTAIQMQDWFGDLCSELTTIYIADPRVMQRIGFTGFADERGFAQIRLNEREDFEL